MSSHVFGHGKEKNRALELTTLISSTQGTGKTSLLLRMSEEAESNGWIAARTTCLDGMLEDIYVQALKASRNVLDSTAPRKVASIGVGSFSIGWESQRDALPSGVRAWLQFWTR